MKLPAFSETFFTTLRGLLPLVILLAPLVSGCAPMKAYGGPELERSEIAIMQTSHTHGETLGLAFFVIPVPEYRHRTTIDEIDGKSVRRGRIHIRPGRHSARVSYARRPEIALCGGAYFSTGCLEDYATSDLSIDFIAEAGHEYRVPAERRGERNWIWVEDMTAGKVIAGERPPAMPPE